MTPRSRRVALGISLAFGLAACVPGSFLGAGTPTQGGGAPDPVVHDVQTFVNARQLVGQVRLDLPGDRGTQATLAEVVNGAVVSVFDPANNITIATALTNANGQFVVPLPGSWNPPANTAFIVEVVKGLGSQTKGKDAVRLRTAVMKLANGTFTSITGSNTILVTPLTTTLALRSSLGFGGANAIPVASLFAGDNSGTVNPATGALKAANQFSQIPDADLNTFAGMVSSIVTGDADPVQVLRPTIKPTIASFSTYQASVGNLVVITGTGFHPTPSSNTVTFANNQSALVWYAGPTQLVVAVPPGAVTGAVRVATAVGTSDPITFTVVAPLGSITTSAVLASVNLRNPNPGQEIILGGSNFVNGTNAVSFNAGAGNRATVNATFVNSGTLRVTVPATARSGAIWVDNGSGISNGFWLEVLRGSGSIVENFTTNANVDAAATNIQWVGGVTPIAGSSLVQNTISAFDTNTLTNTTGALDAAGAPTLQLAVSNTPADTGVNSGNWVPVDTMSAQFHGNSQHYPYSLATDGYRILTGQGASNYFWSDLGFGTNPLNFNLLGRNVTVPSLSFSQSHKSVGFTSSPIFLFADTQADLYGMQSVNMANPRSPVFTPVNLVDSSNVGLNIRKIAGQTYGIQFASDGTYVYVLGGVGFLGGIQTYNSAVNLYRFSPDNYTNPTRLIMTRVFQNVALSSPNFQPQNNIAADRRGLYIPRTDGAHYYTMHSLATGADTTYRYYFHYTGQLTCLAASAPTDTIIASSYNNPYTVRNQFPKRTFATTGSAITPTVSLPNGQGWAKVDISTAPLPAGTNVRFDILRASDNSAVAGFQNLAPGAYISGLQESNIKVRVNLTGPGTITPTVKAINVYTIPSAPVARSARLTIPGAAAEDVVTIESIEFVQAANGGTLRYQFADSSDGNNFSAFADGFSNVRNRFLKFQVVPTIAGDVNTTTPLPVVRQLKINYRY
jgi:hypothetical protein